MPWAWAPWPGKRKTGRLLGAGSAAGELGAVLALGQGAERRKQLLAVCAESDGAVLEGGRVVASE